jgi:cellulose synthase/poly-beta-1,6-N-acetylglucosamine synthase-like glycosyltransferase
MDLAWTVIGAFTYLVLGYFFVLNSVYLATSIFAFGALRRYSMRMKSYNLDELVTSAGAPPISLIAPAYNEEATCVESIQSLLTLDYPEYEILVVNDGSSDSTLDRMTAEFNLVPTARMAIGDIDTAPLRQVLRSLRHPNLWVLDKDNGGKADALNLGINYCRTPLFCAMDSDSLLERHALSRIVRPFLEDADTVAAGGILRIANGCVVKQGQVVDVRLPRNVWAQFQVLEYLRAFLSGRMGWDALQATLVISGAFGIFKREAVVSAGGYATDTVGEDMELVVRLHRTMSEQGRPYSIHFVPDPVAWTECPENLRSLSRQRDRWQRGLFQTLTRHSVMLLNPRYGRVGLLAFPYFFFLEMLGPIVESLGHVSFMAMVVTGRVDLLFGAAFLGAAVVLGTTLSISAVVLEELSFRRYPRISDLARLFALAVVENLGYRQLSAWWRLKGMISALKGDVGWGAQTRRGFTAEGR